MRTLLNTGIAPPAPGMPAAAISAIVVDPGAPLVIYAGVGAAAFPGPEGGVLERTDGGATWTAANNGLTSGRDVRTLVIDPSAPATLYAGTFGTGVFKTTDGGQNWVQMNIGTTDVLVLAIDPQAPATLYAGVGAGTGGAVTSTDGGVTWSPFNAGLPQPPSGTFVMAISPSGACLHAAFGGGLWHLTTRPDACDVSAPPVLQTTLTTAVLPNARAVQVNSLLSVNATVINTGPATALGVGISLASLVPVNFSYWRLDTSVFPPKLVGLNAPVDIPACVPPAACPQENFVLFMTPTAPFGPTEVVFAFRGTNTPAAPTLVGINTLLVFSSATPTPDMVAVAGTCTNNGIVPIPMPEVFPCPVPAIPDIGFFVVATTNPGIADTITVTADTGGSAVPVGISICETNPLSGLCVSTLGSSAVTFVPAGGQPTFAVFLTATAPIPFDPAANRVFLRFRRSDGTIVGGTSVAVRAP